MVNLVSNALKFTFTGSINVLLTYRGNILKTKVKDTGIGIAKQDIPQLFQLFGKLNSSTSANPQGAGIGLVMCKRLSNALEGDIKLNSEEHKGTTFTFFIKNQSEQPNSERSNAPF